MIKNSVPCVTDMPYYKAVWWLNHKLCRVSLSTQSHLTTCCASRDTTGRVILAEGISRVYKFFFPLPTLFTYSSGTSLSWLTMTLSICMTVSTTVSMWSSSTATLPARIAQNACMFVLLLARYVHMEIEACDAA